MCIVSKGKTRTADKYFCDPKHSLKIKDAKKKILECNNLKYQLLALKQSIYRNKSHISGPVR